MHTWLTMIAIILAAGRGTRMGALTESIPKPMLEVCGKNLITWKLEALPEEITEIVIVVGYMREQIIECFGTSWNNKKIAYVIQENLTGTGGALELCKELLMYEERFLVLMGDDIYDPIDLKKLIKNTYSILVADNGESGRKKTWQVFFDVDNNLEEIHQTVEEKTSTFINAGAYCLGQEYFLAGLQMMGNGEYSIPHTLVAMISGSKESDSPIKMQVVMAKKWLQLTDPESIIEAEKYVEDGVLLLTGVHN